MNYTNRHHPVHPETDSIGKAYTSPSMSADEKTTSRRQFLTSTAAAAVAAAIPAKAQNQSQPQPQAPAVAARKKPLNVLFFMSDDMRPELASYASRFHTHSPNIDKLGSDGVRFDRNFCQ